MKRTLAACLIATAHCATPLPVFAQSEEIRALQQQIADLEAQNRRIMAQVAELSAQLPANREPVKAAPNAQAAMPAAIDTEGNRSRLSFYGFARVDAILDDSRANAAQTPTYILSEGPGAENDDSFTLHPRLTRLGVNYAGPVINLPGEPTIGAKVEVDFQNGGSESRSIPRTRQVYAKLDWGRGALLVGQTWDIIAPLQPGVNADTMMWNAGNLGDRRVQIRFTYAPDGPFTLAAGLALTGAVNLQDLDGNGVRDGEDVGTPHFQGRTAYGADWFEIGVWGHYAAEETALPISGRTDFVSHSVGIDFHLQPLDFLAAKGEFWTGSGLGDVRGGIGQSVNTLTGRSIGSTGGWLELGIKPLPAYAIALGLAYDNPKNEDLAAGGRKLNRTWYIGNQLRLGSALLLGLDYLHWRTSYLGLPEGTDNRINFYGIYTF